MPTTPSTLNPLDSRYAKQTEPLLPIFSEAGLVQRRIQVEIEYLLALIPILKLPELTKPQQKQLRSTYLQFDDKALQAVKTHEATTRHDVKAVEYYLHDVLTKHNLQHLHQWIHFGLTSEDINNLAQTLQLRDGSRVLLNQASTLQTQLLELCEQYKSQPMLAHTHGQPAIPTTFGKELLVHIAQIQDLLDSLNAYSYKAKLNGAVGTYAAHHIAFPDIDWITFSNKFIQSFDLQSAVATTQILPGLFWTQSFAIYQQLCLQIVSLAQDFWWYISFGYLKQKIVATETGSSTMPQKVNPIDFENAEGNAQQSAALFAFFITKFSASRLQRDLSDSTVRRNFGVAFGHVLVALQSLAKGLDRIAPDAEVMNAELTAHAEVLAEAYQTILRAAGFPNAYEKIKTLSRGGTLDMSLFEQELTAAQIQKPVIKRLLALKPTEYVGLCTAIVEQGLADLRHKE